MVDSVWSGGVTGRVATQFFDFGCAVHFVLAFNGIGLAQRTASTSNRNFEGRQGARTRNFLAPPVFAPAIPPRYDRALAWVTRCWGT